MASAESVEAGVLVEDAGEEPRAEVGAVGLIEEAAPGVGVEAGNAFAQDWVGVNALG